MEHRQGSGAGAGGAAWRCSILLQGADSAGAGFVCHQLHKYLLSESVPVTQERHESDLELQRQRERGAEFERNPTGRMGSTYRLIRWDPGQ